MKKLLAIVLAVVMCTAALLTFVSAEDYTAGTEFNMSKKDKSGAFSYGFINVKDLDITKYADFTDNALEASGITKDNLTVGMSQLYYNGTKPTAFGWGQVEGAKSMFISQMGEALTFGSYVNAKVIKFTAPVDGTYTMTAKSHSFWEGCVATSVNGAEFVSSEVHKGTPAAGADTIEHTNTFSLKAGEAFYIALYRNGTSTDEKDTVTILLDNFKITLDKLGYEAPEQPENPGTGTDTPEFTPVVYDFVASFTDLADTAFSVVKRNKEGAIEALSNYSDGTGNIICATSHKKMVGYYLDTTTIDAGDRAHNAVFYSAGEPATPLKWYPAAADETIVVFTAPESGKYSFELGGQCIWGTPNSSAKFYVEANGEVVAEKAFEKGLAKDATVYTLTGEVTLKAGETIYFVTTPEDSAAGDNAYLNALKVTLTEKIVDEEPPKTGDALVAVLALVAVAGTALVISKKH